MASNSQIDTELGIQDNEGHSLGAQQEQSLQVALFSFLLSFVELLLETSHINSLAMAQLSPMNMKNFPKLAGAQQMHTSHAMALNWPRALDILHSLHPARPTCGVMNLKIIKILLFISA